MILATPTIWKCVADELPDDDVTVLIALADGEVWTGFLDAGEWRYVSADLIECRVTHWADFPSPPCPLSPLLTSPSVP